jgi:hypothetical protein
MGLARPQTKAQQAATRSDESGPSAPQSSTTGQDITLAEALDRWYTAMAAGESVKSPRTITAYRYGTRV